MCAVAHRAALTLEEQWETLSDMAQCTSRLTAQDAARVQVLPCCLLYMEDRVQFFVFSKSVVEFILRRRLYVQTCHACEIIVCSPCFLRKSLVVVVVQSVRVSPTFVL